MKFNKEAIERKLKKIIKDYCDFTEGEEFDDWIGFDELIEDFIELISEVVEENESRIDAYFDEGIVTYHPAKSWNEREQKFETIGRTSYDYWDVKKKKWCKRYVD